ncbi:MAG TPA: hydroxymethylbilane synthase [Rhizomicrobium sp.]|jgi:hydroxymethylbilane synthase
MSLQRSSSSIWRIGARGSRLARAQAAIVRETLASVCGFAGELVAIKTTGDRIKDRPLAEAGGKGLFARELEDALLAERIDMAVHSMKDLPAILPDGLTIAAILPRETPLDAFISAAAKHLEDLPRGARLGTSSVRRAAQAARRRPDLRILPLRGNVDTRLAKLDAGEMDAVILAAAGLKRLGLEARAVSVLSADSWLPALSQGAIGIEMRSGDTRRAAIHKAMNDEASAIALACERAFQGALDGSCRTPIAGLAIWAAGKLRFRGEVLAPDGSACETCHVELQLGDDPVAEAERVGREAGLAIRDRAQAWLDL